MSLLDNDNRNTTREEGREKLTFSYYLCYWFKSLVLLFITGRLFVLNKTLFLLLNIFLIYLYFSVADLNYLTFLMLFLNCVN